MPCIGILRGLGAAFALIVSVPNAGAQSQPATPAPTLTAVAPPTSFRLVQIAGQALPALVEKEWRCEEHVTEAQLTLAADSTWTLRSTTRETCGDRHTDDSDTETGRYTIAGQTVRFIGDSGDDRNDGDDDVDIDDLGTGTLGADGSMAATLADGRTELVFQR